MKQNTNLRKEQQVVLSNVGMIDALNNLNQILQREKQQYQQQQIQIQNGNRSCVSSFTDQVNNRTFQTSALSKSIDQLESEITAPQTPIRNADMHIHAHASSGKKNHQTNEANYYKPEIIKDESYYSKSPLQRTQQNLVIRQKEELNHTPTIDDAAKTRDNSLNNAHEQITMNATVRKQSKVNYSRLESESRYRSRDSARSSSQYSKERLNSNSTQQSSISPTARETNQNAESSSNYRPNEVSQQIISKKIENGEYAPIHKRWATVVKDREAKLAEAREKQALERKRKEDESMIREYIVQKPSKLMELFIENNGIENIEKKEKIVRTNSQLVESLNEWQRTKELKIQEQQKAESEKSTKNLTFKPKINPTSAMIAQRQSVNEANQRVDVVDRLYKKREEAKAKRDAELERTLKENFPFKPLCNKRSMKLAEQSNYKSVAATSSVVKRASENSPNKKQFPIIKHSNFEQSHSIQPSEQFQTVIAEQSIDKFPNSEDKRNNRSVEQINKTYNTNYEETNSQLYGVGDPSPRIQIDSITVSQAVAAVKQVLGSGGGVANYDKVDLQQEPSVNTQFDSISQHYLTNQSIGGMKSPQKIDSVMQKQQFNDSQSLIQIKNQLSPQQQLLYSADKSEMNDTIQICLNCSSPTKPFHSEQNLSEIEFQKRVQHLLDLLTTESKKDQS